MIPSFKDFNERKEKRIPNEYHLVAILKERLKQRGYNILSHNRFGYGFDIVLEDNEGKIIGVEIKSLMYTSDLMIAIGQCVYRLGRKDTDKAIIYSNFAIDRMQDSQEYLDHFNLPITLASIEAEDGHPFYVTDDMLDDWVKNSNLHLHEWTKPR